MWNEKPTVSPPYDDDGSLSTAEIEQLEQHFSSLSQSELIPAFLKTLEESSLLRQGQLVKVLVSILKPGEAWLALLTEMGRRRCRIVAYQCLRQWSNKQVSQALLQGVEAALEAHNGYLLQCLMALTFKVAWERPDVVLRPVEQLLWKKRQEYSSYRLRNQPFRKQVEHYHKELTRFVPSTNLPLVAMAPQTENSLPVPAGSVIESIENLPMPAQNEPIAAPSGFWQRLFGRFRK